MSGSYVCVCLSASAVPADTGCVRMLLEPDGVCGDDCRWVGCEDRLEGFTVGNWPMRSSRTCEAVPMRLAGACVRSESNNS